MAHKNTTIDGERESGSERKICTREREEGRRGKHGEGWCSSTVVGAEWSLRFYGNRLTASYL